MVAMNEVQHKASLDIIDNYMSPKFCGNSVPKSLHIWKFSQLSTTLLSISGFISWLLKPVERY